MRDVFREWYEPTSLEYEAMWDSGVVVLDASALLGLYRMDEPTASACLELFDWLGERLWLPYQAGFEFHKNRLGEIERQRGAYASLRTTLDGYHEKLVQATARHAVLRSADFLTESRRKFTELQRMLERLEDDHAWPPDEGRSGEDGLLGRLGRLFDGKVGDPLEVTEDLKEEAAKRMASKTPPGFKDTDSGTPVPGDLIIWWELLRRIPSGGSFLNGVLFVTDDRKEDWWLKDGNGARVGPRPELAREALDAGTPMFWMQTPEGFVRSGAQHLGWEVEPRVANSPNGAGELRERLEEPLADGDQRGSALTEAQPMPSQPRQVAALEGHVVAPEAAPGQR